MAQAGFSSYIDLLWRDRACSPRVTAWKAVLYRMDRLAAELPHCLAKLECVLRPAVVDLDGAVSEGFAITLYVKASASTTQRPAERWDCRTAETVSTLLRSRELLAV